MTTTSIVATAATAAAAAAATAAIFTASTSLLLVMPSSAQARLADRSRVVKARAGIGGGNGRRDKNNLAIEGAAYRGRQGSTFDYQEVDELYQFEQQQQQQQLQRRVKASTTTTNSQTMAFIESEIEMEETTNNNEAQSQLLRGSSSSSSSSSSIEESSNPILYEDPEQFNRRLSSQLTGCCYTYKSYSASGMCSLYGENCNEGGGGDGHNSGDASCEQKGLSFIGISFSVNTPSGNPYSYQLCDQFPMENIIDRNYNYVMSMDEDGWLVGGGYKSFDYSGKMPYIDSSHTEIVRIGSMDVNKGGTTIDTVYEAMNSVSFAPFSIYPEYLKSGGGHHSGDQGGGSVPSADITLIVSVVDTYESGSSYSAYDVFLDSLFSALSSVHGGSCMDDHDTDPHVSMARGVKFKSSWHKQQYAYNANLEVAVWQAMYPKGVPIGSSGYASFPAGGKGNKQYVGYGNLYFFFDRANITKAFRPNRDLSSTESYYATLYKSSDTSSYYSSTTSISFNYAGSQDKNGNGDSWEHNPYSWKATMAMHDMTDGWDLPPNCDQEGETFFGIPLSRKSDSNLQSSSTFQNQFDFENIIDRNYTYIKGFGTNHGWLVGEQVGNGAGSIVDKDTAHIPIFYTGTTNPAMGGISLANLIKVGKRIEFGSLYIKPAFVFIDDNGHIKLQFEMDPNSALAYLYNNLCKELGIAWNYDTPYNKEGVYTNCAMHAAGDRAKYGCGPDGSGIGGFCPQMTVAYSVKFQSADLAAAYIASCNNYVDYWRSLYPSGVAVGTSSFCPSGGCLGLFLNRYDLFNVFKPDLGGSWVEYGESTMPPTTSPAPTWPGGCDEPHNFHLDRCFRKRTRPKASAVVWDSLGAVGQFTLFLLVFMSVTLAVSIFLARARKKRRKGESYMAFMMRDSRKKSGDKKKKKRKVKGNKDLEEAMLDDSKSKRSFRSSSRSRSKSISRSRSKSRAAARESGELDEKSIARSRSKSTKSRSKSRRPSSTREKEEENDTSTHRQQLV